MARNGRGDEDPDAEVAAALRDVFRAMDQSNGSVRAMDQSDGSVADSGDSNGAPHAGIGAVQNAVAPTALRKALAVLTQGRGSLFGENEMADASEALQAIFHSVHRALRPAPGTKHARPLSAAASSRSGGMFLDQESGYCSVVHRCFGVDVEESMTCSRCAVRSRTLRYTKFLHLVPAAALNLAMAYADGVDSMESAMRHIDGSDAKPCDVDAGGCGAMNGIEHALAADGVQRKSPAIFVALGVGVGVGHVRSGGRDFGERSDDSEPGGSVRARAARRGDVPPALRDVLLRRALRCVCGDGCPVDSTVTSDGCCSMITGRRRLASGKRWRGCARRGACSRACCFTRERTRRWRFDSFDDHENFIRRIY